jgi:hypothetical protein
MVDEQTKNLKEPGRLEGMCYAHPEDLLGDYVPLEHSVCLIYRDHEESTKETGIRRNIKLSGGALPVNEVVTARWDGSCL